METVGSKYGYLVYKQIKLKDEIENIKKELGQTSSPKPAEHIIFSMEKPSLKLLEKKEHEYQLISKEILDIELSVLLKGNSYEGTSPKISAINEAKKRYDDQSIFVKLWNKINNLEPNLKAMEEMATDSINELYKKR